MHTRYPYHRLLHAPKTPKRRRALTLLASLFVAQLQIVMVPLMALSQETPPVIIQEVAWAGSSLSNADEWIELANLSDATTTIGGWSLHGAGSNDRIISLPDDAAIPPFGTYVVANYAEDHEKSSLAGPVQLATSTIGISNSALALELRDANGLAVDRAGDGTAPFAGSSAEQASMIRTDRWNGDRAESWTSATSSIGFKPDLPDQGTPGFCDLCVVPDEPEADDPVIEEPVEPEEGTATSTDSVINERMSTSTEETVGAIDAGTSTSTDPEIISDDPTSTSTDDGNGDSDDSTSEDADVADGSQTEETTDEIASEETETNDQTNVAEQSPSNDPVAQSPEIPIAQSANPPLTYRLNEAVSNPLSGPEWVEIYVEDAGAAETDRELELHDASGKIATIPEGTAFVVPNYLLVVLSSAKLNNGGDELSLRETNGIVIDQTEIPQTYKGEAWAKDPQDSAWKIAETLTPGARNVFPTIEIEPAPASEETEMNDQTNVVEQWSDETMEPSDSSQPSDSASATTDRPQTTTDYSNQINEVFTAALASNTQTRQPENTSTSKQTSASPSDLTPYPFDDMFDASLNEARVRVTGVVASIPKLLGAAHNFILQNEDGRGLIVYLPSHLNVPPLGSTVAVGGTLKATYKGPELRMKKTDIWKTAATSTPPVPRLVDLLAPSTEDAWSLVAVEGTVMEVKSKSFVLETDDGIEVPVNVPTAVGYSASRLAKEDRVRVTGLLDIGKDAPTIIPRTAEEIELLKHAEDTLAAGGAAPERHFPDWVPFGAAGGAIALTGASKRARELLRKRKLQLLMKKAEAVG